MTRNILGTTKKQGRAPRKIAGPLSGFWRTPKSRAGILILSGFVFLGIFGPLLAPYDPNALGPELLQPPSWSHPFGTTQTGRDVFSQFLVGAQNVMLVGFIVGFIAVTTSMIIGINAALFPGIIDDFLSGLTNVFLVIPSLPLLIVIASLLPAGGGVFTVALVISVTSWAWGARVLRAQTLSLRNRDFVQAARATGKSTPSLIGREIVPNLLPIIAGSFAGTVNWAVLAQVSLSFIGIGSTNDWNWGTILFWAQAQSALQQGAWWWFLPAGLAVALLGMSLVLITLGIDEFVNPRLRSGGLDMRLLRRIGVRSRVGYTAVIPTTNKGKGRNRD